MDQNAFLNSIDLNQVPYEGEPAEETVFYNLNGEEVHLSEA